MLLKFRKPKQEHLPLLIHAIKDSQINIPNLPQSDYPYCLDGSFSLGQLSGKNCLTVGPIQFVISLETHVKVHEGIQRNRLVSSVINQESLVFRMAVCVAHQIIQNVHALIDDRV